MIKVKGNELKDALEDLVNANVITFDEYLKEMNKQLGGFIELDGNQFKKYVEKKEGINMFNKLSKRDMKAIKEMEELMKSTPKMTYYGQPIPTTDEKTLEKRVSEMEDAIKLLGIEKDIEKINKEYDVELELTNQYSPFARVSCIKYADKDIVRGSLNDLSKSIADGSFIKTLKAELYDEMMNDLDFMEDCDCEDCTGCDDDE